MIGDQFVPRERQALLDAYAGLLLEWNQRINLVSRASAERIRDHHIPHCLTLASRPFPAGATVVDFGTGGGLPMIPLAIALPEVAFVGIDSTGKKVAAVTEMARSLGLGNVDVWNGRAESWGGHADYAVSRATAPLRDLWFWFSRCRPPVERASAPGMWRPGLLCLKGGDVRGELRKLPKSVRVARTPIEDLLGPGEAFAGKYILHATGPAGARHRPPAAHSADGDRGDAARPEPGTTRSGPNRVAGRRRPGSRTSHSGAAGRGRNDSRRDP